MVIIKEVTTKAQLKKFMSFPNKLYKDCEYYIPPMFSDEVNDFTKKNPAFSYCEAKCFLAYREGEIVGRIGAILSEKANEKWGYKRMRFTEVDFIDDFAVSSALFDAVEKYAREKECLELHGPLGFCDLDREGMLVEGFDQCGQFFTYYNYPYYIEHLERLGFTKDVDWVEFKMPVPDSRERIERIAAMVEKRYHLRLADIRTRFGFIKYIPKIFIILNQAYAALYGVVPLTDAQVKKYTNKFLPLLDPRFTCFVLDEHDEPVAFGITGPSIGAALKKSNGHLYPTTVIRILRAMRKNDKLDMFLVAVRPDMQGEGINALLINHIAKSAKKMGLKLAETGPMLETNNKIQSQWKNFTPTTHKRRRCFIKEL